MIFVSSKYCILVEVLLQYPGGAVSMTTIRDRQQSTLLVIDSSASVVGYADHHVSYTPHGYTRQVRMSGIAFKGQHLDAVTERYPLGNGYRFHSPALLRFCSPDNESPFGLGGVNSYAFVSGDPVNGSDPTGHSPWTKVLSAVGESYNGKGSKIDGVKIFYSEHPVQQGKKLLNVVAHGAPGKIKGKERGYSPREFADLLVSNNISVEGQESHFIACYSAAPLEWGGASFIKQWTQITGAKTTGYRNTVVSLRSSDGDDFNALILPTPRALRWLTGPEPGRKVERPDDMSNLIPHSTR